MVLALIHHCPLLDLSLFWDVPGACQPFVFSVELDHCSVVCAYAEKLTIGRFSPGASNYRFKVQSRLRLTTLLPLLRSHSSCVSTRSRLTVATL